MATVLGAIPPFLGPIIYMFFRPPEYLEDVRERELRSAPWSSGWRDATCTARSAGRRSTRRSSCPVCTTKLKQACVNCKQPLEALWQICPYCETRVETPATIDFGDTWETPRRRRAE